MAMRVSYTVANGRVLSENRNAVTRDYFSDALGSTVALLDNTQAKTDTFSYWPYGEVKTRTGATATPFQFVGSAGYFRDSSARNYVRARYLNVQQGRWVTKDAPELNSEKETNAFVYVTNIPTGTIDRKGLFHDPECPKGYEENFVTCYGTGGKGFGYISSHHKNCHNPPGHERRPEKGDCAIDQDDPTCEFGQTIIIRNYKTKLHPEGERVWECVTCDSGHGHKGVDIFIPFPDSQCSVNLHNYSHAWHGAGDYCVKCL